MILTAFIITLICYWKKINIALQVITYFALVVTYHHLYFSLKGCKRGKMEQYLCKFTSDDNTVEQWRKCRLKVQWSRYLLEWHTYMDTYKHTYICRLLHHQHISSWYFTRNKPSVKSPSRMNGRRFLFKNSTRMNLARPYFTPSCTAILWHVSNTTSPSTWNSILAGSSR